ncbi:unnamed protein product [Candida verbasci]|uniref:RRM domain-containing protein n=1 Tax=Candida verbasci TaxID=1227364 RepID=A0A9W4TR44_9ASCO|nr:unnamed protein product [Candida verbasci]
MLIHKLHDDSVEYQLDYSKFISHPGILFIKNLSTNLMFNDEEAEVITITKEESNPSHVLFQFLLNNSLFRSLNEVKIFSNTSGNDSINSSSFAIVKFDNYLDVEILIEKFNKHTPNIFNNNQNIPLFLNKYLNKRERFQNSNLSPSNNQTPVTNSSRNNSIPSSTSNNENFNLIILENLINFLPKQFTIEKFKKFLDKFKQFNNQIDSIYFPIFDKQPQQVNENEGLNDSTINCFDFGYIKFTNNENLMDSTLKILYYLNELTWDDFMDFDTERVPPLIANEVEKDDANELDDAKQNRILLTIAQHKHNHYLFSFFNNFYLSLNSDSNLKTKIEITYPNPIYIIDNFFRNLNYQETNIYVNNLPIVFNNDDLTWECFWKQFGAIKSAKIIKPQFYHENEDESKSGKIGFIFYKNFKMAIKSILMTNNKIVNFNDKDLNNKSMNPIIIQSSFAIQKLNNNNSSSAKSTTSSSANSTSTTQSSSFYQPIMPYFYGYPPNPYLFTHPAPIPPPSVPVPPINQNHNANYSNYLMTAKNFPYCYFEQDEKN